MPRDDGIVVIFTGKGKGKTTAALGIVLRSVGHGQRVAMIQFIKGEWYYGELTSSRRLEPEFDMIVSGKGFVGILDDDHSLEEHETAARKAVSIAKEKVCSGEYDVVILDEINYALKLNLIVIEDALDLIKCKAKRTSVILTGNYAPPRLIEMADMVTEMREIKHPFRNGVKARKGIDF
jgi:cob(I)alamin adenosyltransferase